MATVTIHRQWGTDGDGLMVRVSVSASFPDVVAEAKRTALDAYREAIGVTLADEVEGD